MDKKAAISIDNQYHQIAHNSTNDVNVEETVKEKTDKKDQILILCTVTLCSIFVGMHWIAFPIFYVEFSEYFGKSKMIIGGVGSLQHATSQLLGVIISAPIEVYGSRPVAICGGVVICAGYVLSYFATSVGWLYVTFGVIAGTGHSLMNLPLMVLVQQHFDKNRSIATSILMMGKAAGQLIGPMILEYLVLFFTWRGALLIYGGLLLHTAPLAMLLHPPNHFTPPKKKGVKQIVKRIFDFALFKEAAFTLFCLSIFMVKFNIISFFHHLPSRMVYYGSDKLAAAWLLTIAAATSLASRFIFGIIGNTKYANRTVMYTFFCLVCALVSIILPFVNTYAATAVLVAMFGAGRGSTMLMLNVALVDMFGVDRFARSKGLLNVFAGVADLFATPFSGWLFDLTDNYNIPYLVTGIIGMIGAILACFGALNSKLKHTRSKSKTEKEAKEKNDLKLHGQNVELEMDLKSNGPKSINIEVKEEH